MRMKIIIFICAFLFLFTSLYGCSGNISTPVNQDASCERLIDYPLIVASAWSEDGVPQEGMAAMGLFNIHFDPIDWSVDITSLRTGNIFDTLEVVDITNSLTLVPCTDCVRIKSMAFDADSNIVLSIGIKHPFKAGNPSKPITALNRADLHVFNIEGIVISNAPVSEFTDMGERISGFRLQNADGYTGYLDASIDEIYPTDATIHPYKLHFDDYSKGNFDVSNPMGFQSVTTPPPTGNLVMAMGCDYNYQDYVFSIDESASFMFAVGCTFGLSATKKSQRFSPEYRLPQYNKKAASEVSVEVKSNNLIGGVTSSSAELEIHVVDISHNVPIGNALNEMEWDSSVKKIMIEIPGILPSPLSFQGDTAVSGSGHDPSDPLVYIMTITNSAGGIQGSYSGLVKVVDKYPVERNVFTPIARKDGIERVPPGSDPLEGLFGINEFATYQVFTIDILSQCGYITGSIIGPTCPVTGIGNGQKLDFTVEAQSDNAGGDIVLYEADMDYDGATFTVDSSSTDGYFEDVGPFTVPDPCTENIPYEYTVAFRATDQCTPPNQTIFATCTVLVESCVAPVGGVTLTVNRRTIDDNGIDTTQPWVLSWEPGAGAEEYAIYCDYDPSDGIDNNFQPVDVVPASVLEFVVPSNHITDVSGWVRGNTYTVRNRQIAGDPSSELANSEYAFIMTSCFDTLITNLVFGYPDGIGNTEGWKVALERTPYASDTGIRYWPYVSTSFRVSDPNSLSMLAFYLGADWTAGSGQESDNYPGHLVAETVETPSIPQSSTRMLEFVATVTNGWDCDEGGGVIIGFSHSLIQPGDGWNGSDFRWIRAYKSDQGFKAYNWEHASLEFPFPFDMGDYTPGEKNCWKWRSG